MKDYPKPSSSVKRGSAELAILSVLAEQPLHGYQIAKRIREQTAGVVSFDVASLYPVLYTLESRGLVKGEWEEVAAKSRGRRRRYYRLTPDGHRRLKPLRREWREYFHALDRLARLADA
jgi:DNA-binding PadR family transcriptional regulator